MNHLLFPVAAAVNLFSVTALLILAGLAGKGSLAADIAIVQAALLAIFTSLSGNARNLILSESDTRNIEKNILFFRLILMLPAAIIVYYLASSTAETPTYLILGLVMRKCAEWIAELQLAHDEVGNNFTNVRRYIFWNGMALLALISTLFIPTANTYVYYSLALWSFLPLLFAPAYFNYIANLKKIVLDFKPLIPHMGSTVAIGVSTYVFRVLVLIFAGKNLAGEMFSAYAIGGLVSSLYLHALGPSMTAKPHQRNRYFLAIAVGLCIILGAAIIFMGSAASSIAIPSQNLVQGVGISLIGGAVMILAQQKRLSILQTYKMDVFVPDALSNILLIGSIPFAFFIFGQESIIYFFLWSSILAYIFYFPLQLKVSRSW